MSTQVPPVGARSATGGELGHAFAAARTRFALVAVLLLLASLAWWSTAGSMVGMNAGPSADLGTLGWFAGVWVVMMAAMMFPAVSPTVALYAQMTRRRGLSRPLLFAGGYLCVWGVAGVAAYALFALGSSLFAGQLRWDGDGRWLAAAVLALAALYELTPLKNVCLLKCRSPVGFLVETWRDGPRGALALGTRHAGWCVGCCWALMAALFALGVMSLVWMAFVAALITVEKTLPWRRLVIWGTAALLLALAVMLIVAPHAIPGLVVPGGHAAKSMSAMPQGMSGMHQ